MIGCRAFLIIALLLLIPFPAQAAEPQPHPDFAALGDEIVHLVRTELFDSAQAAHWADENGGYGAAVQDAASFGRETRRRLAELQVSHTGYYTPDQPAYYDLLSIFERVLGKNPETESLGVSLIEQDGGWYAVRVFAGGPAAAAGIRRGDRLATLDGEPFHPKISLRGKAGHEVRLGIQSRRGEALREVSITPHLVNPRKEWLEAQKAGSRILDKGGRLAYVPLWSCAGEDFQGLLRETLLGPLQEAQALVLDLRGGWGGCDPTFVSLFDPAAPDLTRTGRDGKTSTTASSWRKPVVVLVDGCSRSGKEVVAWALQHSHRAVLVGEKTAGAVVAGEPFLLSDGSLLLLAVEDIRVDGERLEGVGVTPDVIVPAELAFAEGRDPQLSRALEVAK